MAKIGDKVKYANEDAYPGMKKPKEITPGNIYTIKDFREPPASDKRSGDCDYQFAEVPDSWYGSKRFEPYDKTPSGGKVHGKVPGISF